MIFYEPGASTTMKRLLRRTLVRSGILFGKMKCYLFVTLKEASSDECKKNFKCFCLNATTKTGKFIDYAKIFLCIDFGFLLH